MSPQETAGQATRLGRLHKESGHLSKNGLLHLGTATCDGTHDKSLPDRESLTVPAESRGLVLQRQQRADDPTSPVGSHVLAQEGSFRAVAGRAQVRPHPHGLSRASDGAPTIQLVENKRCQTNGIRIGLNSDGFIRSA